MNLIGTPLDILKKRVYIIKPYRIIYNKESCIMIQRNVSLKNIVDESAVKLENCYRELRAVMPEYFFKTYTENEICAMLPFLTLLKPNGAPLQTEIGRKTFRFYLRDESCKVLHSSDNGEIAFLPFTGAGIHESCKPFTPAGADQYLVVEAFAVTPMPKEAACFTLEELSNYFTDQSGSVPAGVDELYPRLNWEQLSDLTIDRLAERIEMTLEVQGESRAAVRIVPQGENTFKLLVAAPNAFAGSRYFGQIVEAMQLSSFHIERAYWREFSRSAGSEDLERCAVDFGSFYFDGDADKISALERAVKALYWSESNDLFHREFAVKNRWHLADINFFRACAEFAHSQFSFVNRSAYSYADIERLIVLNPELAASLFALFCSRFDPQWNGAMVDEEQLQKRIACINSGMAERDVLSRNIFQAILNFINCIEKCNFFVEDKGALAFRLKPDFMEFYDSLNPEYRKSFPADAPYGVFFFYRRHAAGFQVRFAEIARGGWRTVVPRIVANDLERTDYFEAARDEFFREVFVLAHTQHSKNKDIFEGGSKMITLLRTERKDDWRSELWEAQKALFAAFLSLINYNEDGTLKEKNIIDRLGTREIVEIGPDENMFDNMIGYMGDYGVRAGYTLGSGIISGKPECGINHKEYGVTSFGVHQYFLRTMEELGIDPFKDDFSVKISGGPFGDVAGNMMKLLLRKEDGAFAYPNMRIIAITDGPAALFDPAGIDRDALSKLVLSANLDKFDCKQLKGEGAFIVYSTPQREEEAEFYRQMVLQDGKLVEKQLSRDEFMGVFQSNLFRYADVFVPCGGRPSTVNINNWRSFANGEGHGCRAIVEGANSFLTPDARIELQKSGILNVKDASANKCGVITSSYEILSGLMLDEDEFRKEKETLVPQVMEILAFNARREAEWLFATRRATGEFLTDLTDRLSRSINAKNVAISEFLDTHPEYITDELLLEHLPTMFRTSYRERLKRLPAEYRKAIAAVELAGRIIYNEAGSLENEIRGVIAQ